MSDVPTGVYSFSTTQMVNGNTMLVVGGGGFLSVNAEAEPQESRMFWEDEL